MLKFIGLVFAVICYANAIPVGESGDNQNWPAAPTYPRFPNMGWLHLPSVQDIANMKPAPGSVFNGVSSSMSSHTEYGPDGKPVTKYNGETLWNNNGTIEKKIFGN